MSGRRPFIRAADVPGWTRREGARIEVVKSFADIPAEVRGASTPASR